MSSDPQVGEQWTCATDLPSQGTDAQVRAWLLAAPGPPVVEVVSLSGESDRPTDVYYRWVGLQPCDHWADMITPTPVPGGGWTPNSAALIWRMPLAKFTETFGRVE